MSFYNRVFESDWGGERNAHRVKTVTNIERDMIAARKAGLPDDHPTRAALRKRQKAILDKMELERDRREGRR